MKNRLEVKVAHDFPSNCPGRPLNFVQDAVARPSIASSRSSLSAATLHTKNSMADDDDDDDINYDNTHRAFLQSLLSRQSLTFEEAKPLLAAIQTASNPNRPTLAEDVSQADFDNYVHTINSHISPFDMEIRSSRHQVTKVPVYALVNTTSDALTQMATIHSADEIAFVKRVLDAMFETYNTPRAEVMAVTSMQALKLSKPPVGEEGRRQSGTSQSQNAGLTLAGAEKVLEDMVSEGWFELSQGGYFSLSPRALMELRSWLIDMYNEDDSEEEGEDEEEAHQKIKFCHACKEIVTVGQRCPKMSCQARLHNHCKAGMFRIQGGQETCPICKTAWIEAPPVGEKASRGWRASNVNGGRSSNANGSRRRSRNTGMDGADDDSDASSGA